MRHETSQKILFAFLQLTLSPNTIVPPTITKSQYGSSNQVAFLQLTLSPNGKTPMSSISTTGWHLKRSWLRSSN